MKIKRYRIANWLGFDLTFEKNWYYDGHDATVPIENILSEQLKPIEETYKKLLTLISSIIFFINKCRLASDW